LGCNLELALGARPVGSAKEVIKHLSASGLFGAVTTVDDGDGGERLKDSGSQIRAESASSVRSKAGASVALDEELEQLLEQVRQGASNVDDLCQRTGWPAAVVQSDVLRLTLQGEIRVGRSGVIEIVNQ
jgi:predicted Rossmann fold nucleotide-binding protein DprA/Smf involved in DNA uptake